MSPTPRPALALAVSLAALSALAALPDARAEGAPPAEAASAAPLTKEAAPLDRAQELLEIDPERLAQLTAALAPSSGTVRVDPADVEAVDAVDTEAVDAETIEAAVVVEPAPADLDQTAKEVLPVQHFGGY